MEDICSFNQDITFCTTTNAFSWNFINIEARNLADYSEKIVFYVFDSKDQALSKYKANSIKFNKIGYQSGYHFGQIYNCRIVNITKIFSLAELDNSESEIASSIQCFVQ